MTSTPLVWVVVPNHNGAHTLELCLRSVLAQDYPRIEVLLADDCSTDSSVEVARSLGVTVVRTAANGGCAVARNTGAAHAVANGAEVLFFLDSDVALEPDAVANAVRLLWADPAVGAVCGVEDPRPLTATGAVARFRALQYHWWSISSEGPISFLFPNLCAVRASVFAELGPFNPALRQTEEVDYGYRMNQRYGLRLTSAVRGRHDPDDRLVVLLRKLFHRGRLRIPLYATARRFASGFETAWRAYASVLAALALLAAPLPVLFGPLWTVVPLALFGGSVACDAGMYRFVRRREGTLFLVYFTAVQFVVNVTITAAVATGVAQWLASRRFRALYAAPA